MAKVLSFSYSSFLLSLAFCIVDLTENIWDAISEIHLNFTDLHQWKFESSGIFSTRSPHRAFFIGAIHFESWKRLWKAWTPNKCKIFVWLSFIIAAGQLITYEGDSSPRPLPPLRPRRWDSPTHTHFLCVCPAILVQHSAALEPVRFDSYSTSFAEWWRKSWRKVPKQHKKGFNSLVILGAWILWKHRISCVFDGSAPNLRAALQSFKDESHLGQVGGAKGLAALGLGC